jgi:predicted nucleotidyltransferase
LKLTLEQVKKSFAEVYGEQALFGCVFGSILEPRFNDDSDIDLAVHYKGAMSFEQQMRLKRLLSDELDRDVDVIDLGTADPIITMQIIRNGQLVFAEDPDQYHQFVARKISEYIDFKRSRELVEAKLVDHRIIGSSEGKDEK